MKPALHGHPFVLCALALTAVGCAATPVPRTLDLSTPEKTITAYIDAIQAEDQAALRSTIAATTTPARAYADDFALLMVVNHRFNRILQQKFPTNKKSVVWDFAADETLKKMRANLAKVTFQIDGDTATPETPASDKDTFNSIQTLALVKVGAAWKLDFNHLPNFENYPLNGKSGDTAAMMYLQARLSPAFDAVSAAMESDKLTTIDQVRKSLGERTLPIEAQVEKKLAQLQQKSPPPK